MDEEALKTLESLMKVVDTKSVADNLASAFEAFMTAFLTLRADNEEQLRTHIATYKSVLSKMTDESTRTKDLREKMVKLVDAMEAKANKLTHGKTPTKGVDYPSEEQFKTLIQKLIPPAKKGDDGKTPMAGVDYVVPTKQEVIDACMQMMQPADVFKVLFAAPDNVIRALNSAENTQIKAEHVEGLKELLKEFKGKKWPPFWAGTAPGTSTGGGGGIGAWSTPTETPDSSITVFTVGSTPPTDVEADGVLQFDGSGYTFAAGQITFVNPPTSSVHYR